MSTPRPEHGPGDTGEVDYITDAVKGMVGLSGTVAEAPEPLDLSTIRRFAQAIMDDDPLYWDVKYARESRYGRVMAPPLLPLHAIRRPGGTPDPLQRAADDSDYDGAGEVLPRMGLPAVPVPQRRLLNGGNDVRISSLAGVGDVIASQSTIEDIYQKNGRSGALIFVRVRTDYWVRQTSVPLLQSVQVYIWR
jgi:hypothetical protein